MVSSAHAGAGPASSDEPQNQLQEQPINAGPLFTALCAALAAEGLPVEDLREPGRAFYAYFTNRNTLAGFGGFETHGEHALVRSIVVLPGHRGHGLVWQIVPAVLAQAQQSGARHAWLLTEGAQRVFSRLGFSPADRKSVPPQIGSTKQFSMLCDDRATLMHRPLEPTVATV
ncbi:MAG: arsenic resistance N-acetyltransferase ArsN2 [Burkholderiaceae bacterium]